MTEDESFIERAKYKGNNVHSNGGKTKFPSFSNIPNMKKDQISTANYHQERSQKDPTRGFQPPMQSHHTHKYVRKVQSNNQQHNKSLLSSDNSFLRKVVFSDIEEGIILIERYLPSDCGGSVGNRSLNSTRETIDSVIYNWQSLREQHKQMRKKSDTKIINSDSNRPPLNAINDNNQVSKDPEYSPPLSNQHSHENGSDGSPSNESFSPFLEIPAHSESLKNEQISQKLQAFGEIPGHILPANRQTYMRHLARIEADPALVKICQNRPDYTPQLRAD